MFIRGLRMALNRDVFVTMNDMNHKIASSGDVVNLEMELDEHTWMVIKEGDALRQGFYVMPQDVDPMD